ncbi:hypothetical protein GSI_04244 [Ganoderma sinense ZZ0214-1]|uniref:Uncharacterized protein n=1 Tax=Ganoderma sinense ZZ0214-1 TaxID=1077348 RepID=A0A2G8SIN5_9APHY|nr:hypothetical protein GSI_04244 [Ganoderma sinense ZZ0214-1]
MSTPSVHDDRKQVLELYTALYNRSTEMAETLEGFISDCRLVSVPRENWVSTLVPIVVESVATHRADLDRRLGSAIAESNQSTAECGASLEGFTATNSRMLLCVSSMVQQFQKHRSLLLTKDRQRLQHAITTLRNDLSIGIAHGRHLRSEFDAICHSLQLLCISDPEICNPASMEPAAVRARLTLPLALVVHVAGQREDLMRTARKVLDAAIGWHDDVAADERHSLVHELASLGAAMDRQAMMQQNAIRAISDERSAQNDSSFFVHGPGDEVVQVRDLLDAVVRLGSLKELLGAFLEGQGCVSESLAMVSRDLAETLDML